MKIWLPKNRKELKKHLSDPLFKNAYFLMLISMLSLLGFGISLVIFLPEREDKKLINSCLTPFKHVRPTTFKDY